MANTDDQAVERARQVGLFRYGLIREAADPALTTKQRGRLVREIAAAEHVGPFGAPVRVSRPTVDRWIRIWRRGGFDALVPAPAPGRARTPGRGAGARGRAETGGAGAHRRAGHRDPADRVRVGAARTHRATPFRPAGPDHPARRQRRRRRSAGSKPPRSTTCGPATRCTARTWAGARRSCSPSSTITVGRWSGTGGRTVKTPSGWRPRCVPGWPPAASRNASTSTTAARSCPASCCAPARRSACRLTHSKPRRPQGRGKIERVFRTVREQFLVELGVPGRPLVDTSTSSTGCSRAWVETVYHRRVHSETGQTPLARLAAAASPALPTPHELREAFLWSETRIVTKTATVSLHGNVYVVDASARRSPGRDRLRPVRPGRRSTIRYDGRSMGAGVPHRIDRHVHPHAAAEPPPAPAPTGIDYLALVEANHNAELARHIDYADLAAPSAAHRRRADGELPGQLDLTDLTGPRGATSGRRREYRPAAVAFRLDPDAVPAATWPPACCTGTAGTPKPPPASAGAWPNTPSACSPARSAPARPSPSAPRSPTSTPARHTLIYLGNPAVGARGLYHTIVTSLGGVPRFHKAALIPQTADALAAEETERGRRVVLVVDEAHLLDTDQLEELRLLTNADMDSTARSPACSSGNPPCAGGSSSAPSPPSTSASLAGCHCSVERRKGNQAAKLRLHYRLSLRPERGLYRSQDLQDPRHNPQDSGLILG